jgi:hypothetical protein
MEFNFTEIDKKNLNVLRARCKVAGLGDVITREFRVDENGNLDDSWYTDDIESKTNGMTIDSYPEINELFYRIFEDDHDYFLSPFNEYFEETSGRFTFTINFKEKIISFSTDINYYTTEDSEIEGMVKVLFYRKPQAYDEFVEKYQEMTPEYRKLIFTFDGGGDNGYVEASGENEDGEYVELTKPLEDVCYEILYKHFAGWEENEGSAGRIVFDFSDVNNVTYYVDFNMNTEASIYHKYDEVLNFQ